MVGPKTRQMPVEGQIPIYLHQCYIPKPNILYIFHYLLNNFFTYPPPPGINGPPLSWSQHHNKMFPHQWSAYCKQTPGELFLNLTTAKI